jgi:hypothetical protein
MGEGGCWKDVLGWIWGDLEGLDVVWIDLLVIDVKVTALLAQSRELYSPVSLCEGIRYPCGIMYDTHSTPASWIPANILPP